MTNWPKIQEYRNLEAKFIDDPKRNIDSAADSDSETVIKDENNVKDNAGDFINNEELQNSESKTVRCVIRKDFEETFKKLDRENGVVNQELVRPKAQETTAVDRSYIDHVRLQNHLKWKRQKEEEYQQKKEAERIAQQKKREEEARLEKAKKLKEKEKEEKLREWQEQKAREKEEKKKEKMVMKMLEKELKVTPSQTVDKEKLIEEWVKLKNRQKQMETEKKAELLKKEEENRALRQNLAELSYRQWKERLKGRMMTLPKNGYQIFGPKPVPVVKEDWNHDFINNSPRNQYNSLRGTKSTTTTSLTFRPAIKELEDLSKDLFYMENLKNENPSFSQLKRTKSGFNLYDNVARPYIRGTHTRPSRCEGETPLKELAPGINNIKNRSIKPSKSTFETRIPLDGNKQSELSILSKFREKHPEIYSNDFMCLQAQGDQNTFTGENKLDFLDSLIGSQILPNKKKIDLYINTNVEEDPVVKSKTKQTVKKSETKPQGEARRESAEKRTANDRTNGGCKQKCCAPNRTRSLSLQKTGKTVIVPTKKVTEPETAKMCRRSRSYEKSIKKVSKIEQKNCSSSKSMVKIAEPVKKESKTCLKPAKSRTSCSGSQKRRSRKPVTPETPTKADKKLSETDYKAKKKLKKKNSLSKSFSFCDSPYYAKNSSKSLNKGKSCRRKIVKDVETKSDEVGQCRALSRPVEEQNLGRR